MTAPTLDGTDIVTDAAVITINPLFGGQLISQLTVATPNGYASTEITTVVAAQLVAALTDAHPGLVDIVGDFTPEEDS